MSRYRFGKTPTLFGPLPRRLYTSISPNGTTWLQPMMSLPKSLPGTARLRITFREGESSVCCSVHVLPVLLAECIPQMARRTARVTAVAGLGACHYEPGMRAGRQGVLERSRLHVWR